MANLPQSVRSALWSYNTGQLDLTRDKQRIILNVLNHGTDEAACWLFSTYPRSDIAEVVERSDASEWAKKSLSFWSVALRAKPLSQSRIGRVTRA